MDWRVDIAIESPGWPAESGLRRLAEKAIAAAIETMEPDLAPGSELSLVFADDRMLAALNRQWRGKDLPTNVLSFPGGDYLPNVIAGPVLGDIVLSLEHTTREASLEGKPFEHHVSHLIIHGFLHLFGYDHQSDTEADRMEETERRALARLGIGDPYA